MIKNTAGNNAIILLEDNSGGSQNASITFNQGSQNTLTIATGYQSPSDLNRIYLAPAGNTVLTAIGGSGGISTAKVGIGTTTPETRLHLLTNTTDETQQLLIQNGSSGDAAIKFNISGDTYSLGIDNSDSDKFKLSLGNLGTNDRLVIDSTGNVGIGTTTPDYKFEVQGIISSADASLQKATFANVGNDLVLTANADATNVTAKILFNSSGAGGGAVSTKMIIDGSGKVGIGTASPNEKLQVAGNIHAYAPSGIDAGFFASTAAGSTTIAIRSSGITHFNGGNVGIGVTTPQKKLSVYGDTLIESSGLTASLWFRPSATYGAGGIQTIKVTGSGNPYHTTTSFSNYAAANVLNIVNDEVGS
jgi:hypothetical protein